MVRRILVTLVVAIAVVIGAVIWGATLYTDYLWFANLGFGAVFWTRLAWQWLIPIIAGGVFALVVFVNLLIARPSSAPRLSVVDGEGETQEHSFSTSWYLPVAAVISLVLGFFFSTGIGDSWHDIVLWLKGGSFGYTDPVFSRDIGFYIFDLPFYRLLYISLQGVLWTSIIASGIVYLISGAVSFTEGVQIRTRAKAHISVLLAGLFVLKAGGYLLKMYQRVYSSDGAIYGVGYTDVHALIPGLKVLAVIAVIAALSLLVNIFRPGLRWTAASVVVLLLASLLGGDVFPRLMQRFVVEPNELIRESPYLVNNIQMTRRGFGLDQVQQQEFDVAQDSHLTLADLKAHEEIIKNIRLWDWRPLLQTYGQLQEMRLYYDFKEVDVDRYWLDGEYRQVMLAARELDPRQVQNPTWINQRLQYTHGYGVVVSPVDEVTPEGLPSLWVKNIPPESRYQELEIIRPEIYYGEVADDYVVVNSRTPEFDYPRGDENAQTRYQGRGGVRLSHPLRRLAFAVRMADPRILISGEITDQSRIMFHRTVLNRVQLIAPFFRYEDDPYLVISQGRLFWIIDGYTTSQNYPLATPVRGWGNYVRNSIKVVVDAYHGSVEFFAMDPEEPIVAAYRRIFPDLIQDIAAMDPDLRQHLRYPEGLFTLQTNVYAAYHMSNPTVFYNREDLWSIPEEIVGETPAPVSPYYIITRLPNSQEPEMVLMQPFTPVRKNNMVAWMAARMDGDRYGELLVYSFPKNELTYGPMQVEARVDQDRDISQLLTLWSQQGSTVFRGNLLVIPLQDKILYVEPVYLQAEQSQMPEMKMVIAGTGTRIATGATLGQALQRLLADGDPQGEEARMVPVEPSLPEGPEFEGQQEYRGLVHRAIASFDRAQERLRALDWAGYGQAMEELETLLRQLEEVSQGELVESILMEENLGLE